MNPCRTAPLLILLHIHLVASSNLLRARRRDDGGLAAQFLVESLPSHDESPGNDLFSTRELDEKLGTQNNLIELNYDDDDDDDDDSFEESKGTSEEGYGDAFDINNGAKMADVTELEEEIEEITEEIHELEVENDDGANQQSKVALEKELTDIEIDLVESTLESTEIMDDDGYQLHKVSNNQTTSKNESIAKNVDPEGIKVRVSDSLPPNILMDPTLTMDLTQYDPIEGTEALNTHSNLTKGNVPKSNSTSPSNNGKPAALVDENDVVLPVHTAEGAKESSSGTSNIDVEPDRRNSTASKSNKSSVLNDDKNVEVASKQNTEILNDAMKYEPTVNSTPALVGGTVKGDDQDDDDYLPQQNSNGGSIVKPQGNAGGGSSYDENPTVGEVYLDESESSLNSKALDGSGSNSGEGGLKMNHNDDYEDPDVDDDDDDVVETGMNLKPKVNQSFDEDIKTGGLGLATGAADGNSTTTVANHIVDKENDLGGLTGKETNASKNTTAVVPVGQPNELETDPINSGVVETTVVNGESTSATFATTTSNTLFGAVGTIPASSNVASKDSNIISPAKTRPSPRPASTKYPIKVNASTFTPIYPGVESTDDALDPIVSTQTTIGKETISTVEDISPPIAGGGKGGDSNVASSGEGGTIPGSTLPRSTPIPTYRPTEGEDTMISSYKPTSVDGLSTDDSLDLVMSERGSKTGTLSNENIATPSVTGGGRNFLREEEEEVKKVGGWMGFAAIVLMIYTAYQMSENPDGICASLCRLIITVLGCIVKIILIPFKYLGGGRPSGGHYMATPDYRDPYGSRHLELA